MTYMSIWKTRPQCLLDDRFSSDTRLTWAGPISTTLYGDSLQRLCRRTEYSKQRLKSHMDYFDPCLDRGPQYWHERNRRSAAYMVTQPDKSKVAWHEPNVMFSSVQSVSSVPDTTESIASSISGANNFCYLCSTLEEHERNHLHSCPRKLSLRNLKARIEYVAPKPKLKKKIRTPAFETNISYKVVVWTANVADAGTDATVTIAINGTKDYLPMIKLRKGQKSKMFCFVQGSKETFYIKGPDLGELQYLTVEHDGLQKRHSWSLEKIEVTNLKTNRAWLFVCKNWLSLHRGDYLKKRDLEAQEVSRKSREYEVMVVTGKKRFAGTDAKVYITIYGSEGSTNKILLEKPNENPFEREKTDKFNIKIRDVGEIKKIRIEHDGSGLAPGWHLDRIIIQDPKHPKNIYYFLYGGWLARDAGDGSLWRELKARRKLPKEVTRGITVKYIVTIKTGDIRFGGTDANVFIQFTGAKGTTKKLKLDDYGNNFERGKTDRFELDAPTVGPLQSIILGHDNFGPGAGWYVDEVNVRKYLTREEAVEKLKQTKKKAKSRRRSRADSDDEDVNVDCDRDVLPQFEEHTVTCQCWIAKDEEQGQTFKEFPVTGKLTDVDDGTKCKYEVTVRTGDVVFAGTDANVFIQFVGANGTSPKHVMDNDSNNFERNMKETFTILDHNVGDLKSIVIGHDNTGFGPSWYLEDVTVKKYLTEDEVMERLKQLKKLSSGKHSNVKDIFDKDGRLLKVPYYDEYYFTHQNWLQDETIFRELEYQKKEPVYREKGKQPSDARKLSMSSSASSDLGHPIRYHVYVTTSDIRLAGTDANVFIQFVGPKGTTDKLPLKYSQLSNKFERGQTDIFEIDAPNVGRLEKIIIGHDNAGFGPGWHLKNVQVKKYLSTAETTEKLQDLKRDRRASAGRVSQAEDYEFECNQWLSDDQQHGSVVELVAKHQ